jgi:hypothetical protein
MSEIRIWEPNEAVEAIVRGDAPDGMRVRGDLNLTGKNITQLPKNLECTKLVVDQCTYLNRIPEGLVCFELSAQDLFITELPSVEVGYRLDLSGCHNLVRLPDDLQVQTLVVRGCTSLESLPEGLSVNFLDITSCVALTALPASGAVRSGRLLARGCVRLESLPPWLTRVGRLDVSECPLLTDLPDGIVVTDWLDIGGSSITAVADPTVSLRWRGVAIEHRVAFAPHTITSREVLAESNVEVRRVLIERMGYGRFLDDVKAKELDRDVDPGGERRLLTVPIEGDEPLVVLAVSCPSTQRRYLLRVPPTTATCHQAAAWIAGFDDASLYAPAFET